MFGIQNFSLFLVSCILLNITPGQDTMYILGRSIAQGRKAGMISVLGIMSGVLVHTLLAAFGLSVILATSSLAFSIVKYLGAGYLVWIGLGFLLKGESDSRLETVKTEQKKSWTIYRQGVLTNVLNPKVSLFFLSFLPQFVVPQADFIFVPFLILGMTFFTTGSIWCLVLVCGSTWLKGKIQHQTPMGGITKKLTGALFVGLGVKLAFSSVD
ncbi:MAG: LysE family translocator [Desulfobacterales bacterium]|nr:MAG: LysE family translocator [Desulfobacterales bacterium]